MIFITVKFKVRPEYTDGWLDLVDDFTQATRDEPGNLWFEWSRSVDDPNEFVLVEAFKDDAAEAHVKSDHFVQAMKTHAAGHRRDAADRELRGSRRGLVADGRTRNLLTRYRGRGPQTTVPVARLP